MSIKDRRSNAISLIKIFLAFIYLCAMGYSIAKILDIGGQAGGVWFWIATAVALIIATAYRFSAGYISDLLVRLGEGFIIGAAEVLFFTFILAATSTMAIYATLEIAEVVLTLAPAWTIIFLELFGGLAALFVVFLSRDFLGWFQKTFDTKVLGFVL